MKKILAIILAAMFVVSMGIMASAEDATTTTTEAATTTTTTAATTTTTTTTTTTAKTVTIIYLGWNGEVYQSIAGAAGDALVAPVVPQNPDQPFAECKWSIDLTAYPADDTTVRPIMINEKTMVAELIAAYNQSVDEGWTDEQLTQEYIQIIARYVKTEDIDKYLDTYSKFIDTAQKSSLWPTDWNEFVKVFTDYIPTAVNQQLDIAARLGWDASDQDFVQDVIDLVAGAAEGEDDAAANGDDTANGDDANPKTGSTASIAVFAVLAVAAAAVVCTKKKED